MCVLKFLADAKQKDSVLYDECRWWHKIYPTLAKYVRTAVFCGRTALVMPHFDTPKRDEATLALVEDALKTFFSSKGWEHPDVRWRNIGVYTDDSGSLKVVIYDLDGVREQTSDGWVVQAVDSLRKSISWQ